MKRITCIFLALWALGRLSAQFSGQVATYTRNADGGVSDALFNYALGSIEDRFSKTNPKLDDIEGTPYESNSFAYAKLFYNDDYDGEVYYRYNGYNQEIEIKDNLSEASITRALNRDKNIRLIGNSGILVFRTFVDKKGFTQNGYLYLIKEGSHNLYRRLKVSFKQGSKAENTFGKDIPSKFFQETEYYLELSEQNRISQVGLSNKEFISVLSDNTQNDMKSYLKSMDLKIKSEYDLIQTVNKLNTLK